MGADGVKGKTTGSNNVALIYSIQHSERDGHIRHCWGRCALATQSDFIVGRRRVNARSLQYTN